MFFSSRFSACFFSLQLRCGIFGWFCEKTGWDETGRGERYMPDASQPLNRLYFFVFSLQPLPSSFATHLFSQPRDVLQVGLCIWRNCYIASQHMHKPSPHQSLTYLMSHSRVREFAVHKKKMKIGRAKRDKLMVMDDEFLSDPRVQQHRKSIERKSSNFCTSSKRKS